MIPISVSDILKILDQIPVWKSMRDLPKRVAELERKVAELQATLGAREQTPKIPEARICPMCGSTMKVIAEHPHPTFDFAGVKIHDMKCPSCDHSTQRDYQPGKGYT